MSGIGKLNSYQKTAIATVIATLLLIMIGGLVRAAGAGLGCPDWPTCFGMWVPPTTADALPTGYDASLFNPFHTWLEYLNRLAGVIIGLLVTSTFVLSFRYRKTDRAVMIASGLAFLLVLFQGWLGGQVVRSGLNAGMITLHMVLAMVIVNTLLYAAFRATKGILNVTLSPSVRRLLLGTGVLLLMLTLVQLVLGTQVREAVDVIKNAPEPLARDLWLEEVAGSGRLYAIHRSFSWLVVLVAAGLFYYSRKLDVPPVLKYCAIAIMGLIILQIALGVGMDWLGMPGVLQLLHLVSVSVLICTEFLLLLITGFSTDPGIQRS